MPLRSRSLRPVFVLAALLASTLAACSGAKPDATQDPGSNAEAQPNADASDSSEVGVAGSGPIGKELPAELVAELRLAGADVDGRLLTLATGFMATAECSDCGAPSYLWFLAVRCSDTRHCEILTEQCEGKISRDDDSFVLEFRPVEGAAAEVCAGYSGTFERP